MAAHATPEQVPSWLLPATHYLNLLGHYKAQADT
jgi:hypothetical protein